MHNSILSRTPIKELPDYSVMARLHRDGRPSGVLQIALDAPPVVLTSHAACIIRRSQNGHSRPRSVVEGRIRRFLAPEKSAEKKRRRGLGLVVGGMDLFPGKALCPPILWISRWKMAARSRPRYG